MSQSFKLYRLQQIDSQLDKALARLKDVESELSEDAILRQAQELNDISAENLQSKRKALQKAEEVVLEQRVKIEQTESTLYSGKVRNPKELQDLQNELASLKKYKSVLEDRQIEEMISVEEAEDDYKAKQTDLEEVRAQLAVHNQELTAERDRLNNEIARLQAERQAAASSIPAEDQRLYEQLRSQRRGIAVSKVTDKACSACGSTLNAALLHAARSPNQITRCEICGRILYGG